MTINWEILVAAIAAIETGSTGPIPGDGGRAIGPLQIHQCVIDEVNRLEKTSLKLSDMTDPSYSSYVCRLYLVYWASRMDHDPSVSELARIWNGGPYGPVKSSTADYGRRVAAMYDSLEKDFRLTALFNAASERERSQAL